MTVHLAVVALVSLALVGGILFALAYIFLHDRD